MRIDNYLEEEKKDTCVDLFIQQYFFMQLHQQIFLGTYPDFDNWSDYVFLSLLEVRSLVVVEQILEDFLQSKNE